MPTTPWPTLKKCWKQKRVKSTSIKSCINPLVDPDMASIVWSWATFCFLGHNLRAESPAAGSGSWIEVSTERVASPEPDLAVCPALAPAIKSYTINRQTLFGPFPHARAHGIHWSRQALFGPVPHCQGSTESTGAGKHCLVLFHIAKVHGIHWSRIGRKDSQEKATSLGHFSDSLVHGLTTRPGSWWPEFVCMYIYIYTWF